MTPFYGVSCLPDLIGRLKAVGLAAARPEERTEQTRVVALPYTIELSLYCAPDITQEEKDRIARVCEEAPYTDRLFGREEMQRDFGLDSRGPEFLVSPRYGSHFYHRDIPEDTFGAGHDSFHETSQHIFGLMLGGDIPPGTEFTQKTYGIDLIPAIVRQRYGWTLNEERKSELKL